MQGRALIIAGGTSTDAAAPLIYTQDPLLVNGSLALIEPAHPLNPWAAGVPASGTSVPNLAWQKAVATIGSGTEATMAGTFTKYATGGTDGDITAERSSKGGLHIVPRPTLTLSQYTLLGVAFATAIKTYMKANKTHAYYLSVWRRPTRAASTPAHPISLISANAVFALGIGDGAVPANLYPGSTPSLGQRAPANVAGTAEQADIADEPSSTFDSATDTNPALANNGAFFYGHRGGTTAGTNAGYGAFVAYRAYLEDLTVSGRSYATVDAADRALFLQECVNAGGRYVGDTYTAPGTLLP